MRSHAIVRSPRPAATWASILALTFIASPLDAQWTPVGPWYGEVSTIVFGPGPSSTAIYAGTGSTVYWSEDDGAHWSWRGDGLPVTRVHKLITSPSVPGVVLAGVLSAPTHRSSDYGASWSPVSGMPASVQDFTVADLSGVETFFAASEAGMFRSVDQGASWTPAGLAGLSVRAVEYQPASGLLLASLGSGDVRRSPDGGATWVPANSGIGGNIYAITAHPESAGVFYAGGLNFGGPDLFKTVNGGTTWQAMQSPVFPTFMFVYDVAIDPTNGARVLAAGYGQGVFRSENGGGTWQTTSTGIGDLELYTLVAHPSLPGHFLCGTQRRAIYRTGNAGTSWMEQSLGISGILTRAIALQPSLGRLWAGSVTGIALSTDNGEHWTWSDFEGDIGATANVITPDPTDPMRLFAGTSNAFFKGNVLRSIDGGPHWENVYSSPRGPVFDVQVAPGDSQRVYAALGADVIPGAVVRSNDGGQTWSEIPLGDVEVYNLAVDPANDQRLLAGTSAGLQESKDRGLSFHPVAPELSSWSVVDIAFVPGEAESVYVASYGGGVWRSGNGGLGFVPANGGLPLPGFSMRALAIRDLGGGHVVFAAGANGVFRSEDHGDAWQDISAGLPILDSRALTYRANQGLVMVGIHGAGIWSRQETGTTDVPGGPWSGGPTLVIDAARPNPVGVRGTSIAYRLASPGRVRIVVLDVAGRRVREFAETPHEAGPHVVFWDARDDAGRPVPSGVYLIRAEDRSGDRTDARRVAVVR